MALQISPADVTPELLPRKRNALGECLRALCGFEQCRAGSGYCHHSPAAGSELA
jgi:hypothetical protein